MLLALSIAKNQLETFLTWASSEMQGSGKKCACQVYAKNATHSIYIHIFSYIIAPKLYCVVQICAKRFHYLCVHWTSQLRRETAGCSITFFSPNEWKKFFEINGWYNVMWRCNCENCYYKQLAWNIIEWWTNNFICQPYCIQYSFSLHAWSRELFKMPVNLIYILRKRIFAKIVQLLCPFSSIAGDDKKFAWRQRDVRRSIALASSKMHKNKCKQEYSVTTVRFLCKIFGLWSRIITADCHWVCHIV